MPRTRLPLLRRVWLRVWTRRPLIPEETLTPQERLWLLAAGAGIAAAALAAVLILSLSRLD